MVLLQETDNRDNKLFYRGVWQALDWAIKTIINNNINIEQDKVLLFKKCLMNILPNIESFILNSDCRSDIYQGTNTKEDLNLKEWFHGSQFGRSDMPTDDNANSAYRVFYMSPSQNFVIQYFENSGYIKKFKILRDLNLFDLKNEKEKQELIDILPDYKDEIDLYSNEKSGDSQELFTFNVEIRDKLRELGYDGFLENEAKLEGYDNIGLFAPYKDKIELISKEQYNKVKQMSSNQCSNIEDVRKYIMEQNNEKIKQGIMWDIASNVGNFILDGAKNVGESISGAVQGEDPNKTDADSKAKREKEAEHRKAKMDNLKQLIDYEVDRLIKDEYFEDIEDEAHKKTIAKFKHLPFAYEWEPRTQKVRYPNLTPKDAAQMSRYWTNVKKHIMEDYKMTILNDEREVNNILKIIRNKKQFDKETSRQLYSIAREYMGSINRASGGTLGTSMKKSSRIEDMSMEEIQSEIRQNDIILNAMNDIIMCSLRNKKIRQSSLDLVETYVKQDSDIPQYDDTMLMDDEDYEMPAIPEDMLEDFDIMETPQENYEDFSEQD